MAAVAFLWYNNSVTVTTPTRTIRKFAEEMICRNMLTFMLWLTNDPKN